MDGFLYLKGEFETRKEICDERRACNFNWLIKEIEAAAGMMSTSTSSTEKKKAALFQRLQRLRTLTNSSAVNKASIIVDATKYIEDLKQKVEETLNVQEIIGITNSAHQFDQSPVVSVQTLEKGFQINVYSEKNCPGLLVSILEAFEELGLEVLDARVSCSDTFQLEAIGGENIQREDDSLDAQVVKQAVLQAINKS